MMLSSQSLMGLLERWDEGLLPDIPELFLKDSVVPVLFGIAVEILQQQQTDGCWGPHSRETTAYAIITLSITASLPLCDVLKAQMDLSINNGREFLHQQIHNWAEPDSIWTGKVSYGLGTVAEAYTIAAMKISPHRYSFNKVTDRICNPVKPSLSRVKKASVLPCLAHMPNWLVDACIVESYLYLPIFNAARKELFTHHIEQQYHLDLIPLAVIACGRARSASIRPEAILAFMVSCARIYQADQYIEDIIGGTGTAGIQEAERMVHEMFEQPADVAAPMNNLNPSIEGLVDAKATLHRLTSWFLTHPQIAAASAYDQAHLRRELKDFYLNQLISVRESACMANNTRCGEKEKNPTQNSTSSHHQQQQTYHKWLHTTAASHVSGFVSLAFFTCLISPSSSSISSNEQDCFPNAEAKFYAHDLSLRLAAMARIENDIGSVRRDRDECNLNSADFPEFASAGDSESGNDDDDMERRLGQLRRLAGYERECYGKALERLRQVPGMREKVVRGLEAYCTMNDFYGELYAMEDLSPRLGRVA
ncbi:MAG: hypothetical protein L6R40_006633 [Gallowayella cf. fulva]|nr:MAG: hypothetical protein L6R40_006633 [Xanthomendoza cf. fulva]